MKTATITNLLAALLLGVTASPIPESAEGSRADTCVINLNYIDSWTDSGLHRFRHQPTADGINKLDVGDVLNKYWPYAGTTGATSCSAIVNNRAAYHDPTYGWIIDENEVYGEAGHAAIDCITHSFMDAWRRNTGCVIKAGSIGA